MPEASLVESQLNDVKKLMQASKFAEAEKHLQAMLVGSLKNSDILYMMAVCLRYQKKILRGARNSTATQDVGS